MPERRTKIKNLSAGFTLIEILIVSVIITFVAGIAIYMSGDFFIANSFESNVSALGISLQYARNQAINNINESQHGVRIIGGDYVIFEVKSGDEQTIKGNSNYTYDFQPSVPGNEIVFEQLSGNAIAGGNPYDGDIVISNGSKTATISINSLGRIDF